MILGPLEASAAHCCCRATKITLSATTHPRILSSRACQRNELGLLKVHVRVRVQNRPLLHNLCPETEAQKICGVRIRWVLFK
jgi:hypothetical protein